MPGNGAGFERDELYRLLIESVRDYAIFLLDPQGRIMSWNPGAQRFKGYTADEILGEHFSIFYTDVDRARNHPEHELEVATREGRYEEEGWRVRKDGTQFWANVVITALRDAGGELVGFAKVTRDLTERRAAQEQAIADARRIAEAESANRAKLEFLAALSHELRTPLNAIGGYVDLMLMGVRGALPPQVRQDLERVKRSQQGLLGLINDLLNYSRIEAGSLQYHTAPVDMAPLLSYALDLVRPQAEGKQISLENVRCEPGTRAMADESKLGQILLNLASNAVRYTEPGGAIRVWCGREGDRVYVDVEDTGVGIPAERLESIFEPFVQLGRSLTSSHEGTGLGLSISRELARAMNGDVTVASVAGEGSTFRLSLPAAG